jgi:hypothetical protein
MENNNGSVFYNKEGSNLQDVQSFGEGGNFTIKPGSGEIDLAAQGKRAVALQCITEVTFTQLTDSLEESGITGDPAEDETYPAGFVLYGNFTLIHVSSGSIRATLASERIN